MNDWSHNLIAARKALEEASVALTLVGPTAGPYRDRKLREAEQALLQVISDARDALGWVRGR